MARLVRVLAIDGGGARGLVPSLILQAIERRVAELARQPRKIHELFDVVAGASTGAVITLLLTKPEPAACETLVQLYEEDAKIFFRRSAWRAVWTLNGWVYPKYSSDNPATLMRKYIGEDAELKHAQTNIVIPIYTLRKKWPRTVLFTRDWARRKEPEGFNFRMWQMACAATAAPTYFPTFTIESCSGMRRVYHAVDGAVYLNNPATEGLAHAMQLLREGKLPLLEGGGGVPQAAGAEELARFLVVSVGTGYHDVPVPGHSAAHWGRLGWAVPVLDVMFEAQAESASLQLEQVMQEHRYFRLQPVLGRDLQLDDTTPAATAYLRQTTEHFLEKNQPKIDEIAKLLASRA
jgi:patatin-like phospholipase/acyl hydrolase